MNIAILGTRGVPPRYGGFETFAAELGTRLVDRGHRVSVYCRQAPHASGSTASAGSNFSVRTGFSRSRRPAEAGPHTEAEAGDVGKGHGEERSSPHRQWRGIECILLPSKRGKYFETVSHSFLSAIDALHRDFDVVLICNAANAFVLPLLRAARIPVAINVDGIERRRRKWNVFGRAFYAIGESLSALFAGRVIADAGVIADYYRERFGIESATIPYGADFPSEESDTDVLQRLKVDPRHYILYVSRFEPENNPLEVVLAYEKLSEGPPLVMVGEGLYAEDLVAELHRHASGRVIFPGAIYGADYRTLQRNSLIYIQATEVGGTHPALIEAMGAGACVLANDTPENREVGGDAVGYFQLRPTENLSTELGALLGIGSLCLERRTAAKARATARYRWESVVDEYERLFQQMLS